MKGRPGFVEPNLRPKGFDQGRLVLLPGEVQGLVRRLHGLGKAARLGIGGGQRVQGFPALVPPTSSTARRARAHRLERRRGT